MSVLLLLLLHGQGAQSIWFPWYFHRYGLEPHSARHGGRGGSGGKTPCPPGYELRSSKGPSGGGTGGKAKGPSSLCDDNPLVMQLARLYLVSPERIVLLLAQPLMLETCAEINDVLEHIESATSSCVLTDDNIYGKLRDGLSYYKTEVCDGGGEDGSNRKRCTDLNEAHNCIKELRTDMIECEAPADWYEWHNATKVCQNFNDVLDCYYTRTAMLCGLDAAKQLRSFAGDSMGRALVHKCVVNKRLPRVSDPMPNLSAASWLKSSLVPIVVVVVVVPLQLAVYLLLV
ncbi:CG4891 [Drosophila busckii]|uniref:CG4891 n=1 Tax=Drosophila busckii TaxID=30019 RepID=A0A0M5J9H1_DROBS|nr:CG4891 [Drosophila busckii]